MNQSLLSKMPRYEICEKAEEAVSRDDLSFLQQATDWIHRDDAIMLANVAAEKGSSQCFRYLVDNLTTPQNRTSHITSFLCRATAFDQDHILSDFLPIVSYNMVSMSKIFTHIIRSNANKCFDVVLEQPSLPPSVIPTAFLALLEKAPDTNKHFLDTLYPRLDVSDLSSVFVSRFEQIYTPEDASFLDEFLSNIPSDHFEEVYPRLHPFTKDFDLPNMIARNSKLQLNKMLAPSMEGKLKASPAVGLRKM